MNDGYDEPENDWADDDYGDWTPNELTKRIEAAERFKQSFEDMYCYVQECSKNDCEVTLGGNGINCHEASAVMRAVKELVDEYL